MSAAQNVMSRMHTEKTAKVPRLISFFRLQQRTSFSPSLNTVWHIKNATDDENAIRCLCM